MVLLPNQVVILSILTKTSYWQHYRLMRKNCNFLHHIVPSVIVAAQETLYHTKKNVMVQALVADLVCLIFAPLRVITVLAQSIYSPFNDT